MRRGATRPRGESHGGLIAALLRLLSRGLSGCPRIEMMALVLLPSTAIGKNVVQQSVRLNPVTLTNSFSPSDKEELETHLTIQIILKGR